MYFRLEEILYLPCDCFGLTWDFFLNLVFIFKNFIDIELVYNVVLISGR